MGSAGGRSVALRESGYVQSNEDGFGVNFDGTSKQHNESVRRVELAPEIMALVWLPQLQTCEERARERQALAPRNLGAPRLRRLTASSDRRDHRVGGLPAPRATLVRESAKGSRC